MPQEKPREEPKEKPKEKKIEQKPAEKKGKPLKRKRTSRKYKGYESVGGALKRKNKFCPKCGSGVFLAEHKDRLTCGKCGYMEAKSRESR